MVVHGRSTDRRKGLCKLLPANVVRTRGATAILVSIGLISVASCSFYREGVESAPFVGTEEPARDKWIALEGMRFRVEPLNDVQTLEIDRQPFHESIHDDPIMIWGATAPFRIRVRVVARDHDVEFLPSGTVLYVEARSYAPADFLVEGPVPAMKLRDTMGAKPSEPTFLLRRGETLDVTLSYDLPPPTPDEDIKLDLAPAIVDPKHGKVPVVNFEAIPWSYDSRNP